MHQIYSRTPIFKCGFNKVALQIAINLQHIFRTPFLKDTSGGLLLVLSTLAPVLGIYFDSCSCGKLRKCLMFFQICHHSQSGYVKGSTDMKGKCRLVFDVSASMCRLVSCFHNQKTLTVLINIAFVFQLIFLSRFSFPKNQIFGKDLFITKAKDLLIVG